MKEITDILVSKTNPKGVITYCNKGFIDISGYSQKELLGRPHSIVRHPDMPRTIFKFLWGKITRREECNAFVQNRAKNGESYWVFANVTPSFDITGTIIGYYSVRRAPNLQALEIIKELYKQIKQVEQNEGLEAGTKFFASHFQNLGIKYENFVMKAQLGVSLDCEGENCFDSEEKPEFEQVSESTESADSEKSKEVQK